jgi:membrane protein
VTNSTASEIPLRKRARAGAAGTRVGILRALSLPWTAWKSILARVYQQFNDDRLLSIAAGIVFYALLAVFPAITAFVAFYGFFSDPTTIAGHLEALQDVVPASAFGILSEQVNRAASGTMQLGLTSVLALLFAVWSANSGTKAIMDALNVVYGEREQRGFLRLNFVSLLLTLGTMAALLIALAAVVVVPLLLAAFGVGVIGHLEMLRWPLLLALVLAGLAVLYRVGPSRPQSHWSWLSMGTVTAAAGWLATSVLLSWYLSNFANYNAIYGSLGALIGMMMWMWISSIVVLLGAELDAQIARELGADHHRTSAA